jgi:hypothetical protein
MGCGHVLVVECCFIHFCIGVFFLCHYSVVCKKGGPSPYGSPSRNPKGGLAGMLVAATVDARNLAEISVNSVKLWAVLSSDGNKCVAVNKYC